MFNNQITTNDIVQKKKFTIGRLINSIRCFILSALVDKTKCPCYI